jgi:POT family proton-dependent oligopeptide transporter
VATWYTQDKVKFDHSLVTAPPTGNVITLVFEALRRRRVAKHRTSITLVQGRSSTQQDDVVFSNEDENLLRETKAALKACLLL